MDELDRTILNYLQQDGRMPYTEIAQQMDVSEGTIRNRVNRLVSDDILQILGVTDPLKMGLFVSAVIGVSIQGGNLEQAAETIAQISEVYDVVMVSGEFDLILLVHCNDQEHLSTFLSQKLRPISGISHTQTFVILRNFKTTNHIRPVNPSGYRK